jgi:type I restriction enzyme S subunit
MSSNEQDAMISRQSYNSALKPNLRFPEFREAGEWEEIPLIDTCTPILDKVGSAKLTPVSITAGFGFVAQADKFGRDISGDQYKNYIRLKRGDFAYNKGNSKKYPQGYVCQLKEFDLAAASSAFVCFRLKEGFDANFLQGLFDQNVHGRQISRYITSGARSDGLLNIRPDDFFSIKIPVPLQIAEQQQIADCLSSIAVLITEESRKLEALKVYKKGLTRQLFPDEGETAPTLRFPEFRDEAEWKEIKLGSLGELVPGLTYRPEDVQESGLLVLRSSNIKNGKIALDNCVYVNPQIKGANIAKPSDILICVRNGSANLIGKNALIPEEMPLCTHGAFMTVFRSRSARFVFQLFQTSRYQKQVAADLGATINSINSSQLVKYKFFVPKPREQQKIAKFLSSIDEVIAAQTEKLDALKAHKEGLMQRLFPALAEAQV